MGASPLSSVLLQRRSWVLTWASDLKSASFQSVSWIFPYYEKVENVEKLPVFYLKITQKKWNCGSYDISYLY